MIIATGTSARQIVASAKKLAHRLEVAGYDAKIEGQQSGDWVVIDAGDIIIHLFRAEVRSFYNLEKLWATDFSTIGYNLYSAS